MCPPALRSAHVASRQRTIKLIISSICSRVITSGGAMRSTLPKAAQMSTLEVGATAIGQGRVLATPLAQVAGKTKGITERRPLLADVEA